MKVLILGDVHGRWTQLNDLITTEAPDVILQAGDFGLWPPRNVEGLSEIIPRGTEIFWCPGNHENWDVLDTFKRGKIHKLHRNIYYCAFGSTLSVDGKTFLFCGGAFSIDKDWRVPGHNWWPQETISQRDLDYLPDVAVDVVISHTAPLVFNLSHYKDQYNDPSRKALNLVLRRYRPSQWFFGHFHKRMEGNFNGCKWNMLSHLDEGISASTFLWKPL